jgi:hypothetical protein
MNLRFGYNRGVPEDRTVAWGTRCIITEDGDVGLLWDLQDAVGPDEPRQRLLGHLQEHVGYGLRWRISGLLKSGAMRTREDRDFTLYEDSVVTVVGNTNASAVYCDVAAFFSEKELESTWPPPVADR